MSAAVFNLRVPVEADYRSLASEIVSRYFELIGGAEAERKALERKFSKALDEVIGASSGAGAPARDVEVSCVGGAAGGELQLRCGGRAAVVRYPGPGAAR